MRPSSRAILMLAALTLTLVACDDGGGDDNNTNDTAATDTAADTSVPDTAEPDTAEPDVVDPVDPALSAPVRVAVVYRDTTTNDPADMYLIEDVAGSLELRLSDLTPLSSGIDCRAGSCHVTEDLGWFLYQTGTGALQIAEIGGDQQVDVAELQTLAPMANQVIITGTRVAWIAEGQAWFEELADGLHQPRALAEIVTDVGDGIDYTGGGIALGARGDAMLVYRYDLSSLTAFRVPLDGSAESPLYRFGIPRASGSFFTGTNPIVVTQDGTTAVMLLEGNLLYGTCSSNPDCQDIQDATCNRYTDAAGVQSSLGVCAATQRTLQRFALEPSDLGQACTSDDECDPRHRCMVDPTTLIGGEPTSVCAPRQHVIGPRGTDTCNGLLEGHFASILKKLEITPDDRVLYLGINDCGELNVPNNAIVAIDASLDPATSETLEGPYDHDHGGGFCYEESEDRWTYPECTIALHDFDLGPQGGLILRASGKNEANDHELWAYDADGNRYPLTSDIFNDVTGFFAVAP